MSTGKFLTQRTSNWRKNGAGSSWLGYAAVKESCTSFPKELTEIARLHIARFATSSGDFAKRQTVRTIRNRCIGTIFHEIGDALGLSSPPALSRTGAMCRFIRIRRRCEKWGRTIGNSQGAEGPDGTRTWNALHCRDFPSHTRLTSAPSANAFAQLAMPCRRHSFEPLQKRWLRTFKAANNDRYQLGVRLPCLALDVVTGLGSQ